MAEYGVIYLATNRINGKQYVGKTARSMLIRKMFHEHHARKGVKSDGFERPRARVVKQQRKSQKTL